MGARTFIPQATHLTSPYLTPPHVTPLQSVPNANRVPIEYSPNTICASDEGVCSKKAGRARPGANRDHRTTTA